MNLTVSLLFLLVFALNIKAAHNSYLKTRSIKSSLIYFAVDFSRLVIFSIIPIGNAGKAFLLGCLLCKAEIEVFGEPWLLKKIKNLFKKEKGSF